jgi:large subunit ribosomal protein L25
MGDKVVLTVEDREILGKKVKQLRKQGYVPGVVYGHDFQAKPVMVQAQAAAKAWKQAGKHQPVELSLGSTKKLAMIKSADHDPVKHKLRHLSLHVVKQNEKVETEVAVRITNEGETEAEKAGLVILQTTEKVPIAALPKNLPDFLEVSSAKLVAAGDHVTVADITPAEGVEILTELEQLIATVYEPAALAAQNESAAGDATDESEVEAENGAEEATEDGEEEQGKTEPEAKEKQ